MKIDPKHLFFIALSLSVGSFIPSAVRADDADLREGGRVEARRMFDPPVIPLADEGRVISPSLARWAFLKDSQRPSSDDFLARHRFVVLRAGGPGLSLRYFVEGIDTMTPGDLAWEGLPRRAESLQALIDHTIARARASCRPIGRLVIIGHAGLPGTCALGGTMDDCTFAGRLSDYQQRQLRRLRPYLTDDAEIELRQCTTGRGREGLALLTAIHDVTGAAASSYLGDFRFGQSGKHPRVRVDADGVSIVRPD